MDGVESRLSGKSPKSEGDAGSVRLIPEIEAGEENDHFRESIARWSKKTGRDLRAEIDRLKAERATADQTKGFHPEFQRKFSEVFDSFIPIEVVEIRERRNRVIHRQVRALLDPYRATRPRTVEYFEKQIAVAPYQDPDARS
jgi:hypothetical protein